jgi:aryl-alcohol dehydrogenase-like predicted oxidoreductase
MIKRRLGYNGPEVSTLGLGCMGMSEFYGSSDDKVSKKVILNALEMGITMLDTADCYGNGHNERLISEVIKEWSEEIFVATKFGIVRNPGEYERKICGRPEYVRQAVEASLKRLNIETIDLYYIHRIDKDVPIEDTVGAMSDLVNQGKIKYIGLSESSPETVLKAHAVHPITCIQSEYSLFTRDVEESILPVLRQNGIGFVPYSPLGRGMLTGKLTKEFLQQKGDLRQHLPRSSSEYYDYNMNLVKLLKEVADLKGISLSQLALAWILSQGEDIIPIPGTRNLKYLTENINSTKICLNNNDLTKIDAIFYPGAVKGDRYTEEGMKGLNI